MKRGRPTVLLGVLAVLWLAYCLGGLVLSGRVWWWAPADLVPPGAFVLVPTLLLAAAVVAHVWRRPTAEPARRRQWRPLVTTAAALLALLLGAGRSGIHLHGVGDADRQVPDGAVRVVSFNTEYWGSTVEPRDFYGYLKEQDADVYLLQEYLRWDPTAVAHSARPVHGMARLRREFPGYEIVARGELVTLSRFPVLSAPPVAPAITGLGEAGNWLETFTAAKVLRTDLRIDGTVVSVYNVHMPVQLSLGIAPVTPAFFRDVHRRVEHRRKQFRALRTDTASNPCPQLVSGDFNATAAMGELDGLREKFRDAAESGTAVYPTSWPAGRLTGWRLDWTFTGSDLTVHRYRLAGSDGISDHRRQDTWFTVADDAPCPADAASLDSSSPEPQ